MRYAFRTGFFGLPRAVRLASAVASLLAATLVQTSAGAAVPHTSHNSATVGNGFGFAVFDGDARKLTSLTEAPHATKSAGVATRNVLYDAYFGLRASGAGAWLGETPVEALAYVAQSGVVAATQHFGPLLAETYVFSPFGLSAPCVVVALKVTNSSSIAQPDAAAYALLNLHLGAGDVPGSAGEQLVWDATHDAISETGPSGLTAHYLSLVASSHHAASGPGGDDPYDVVKLGGDLVDGAGVGPIDDGVAGFQWSLDGIAAGETRWVGVLITLGDDAAARTFVAGRTPQTLVEAELAQWESWRKPPPPSVSDVERRVYRQSEAVLRMAQSREGGLAQGQIIASLPPGPWWITWVRDMSYAVAALAGSGHSIEAGLGVDFLKKAPVGAYKSYVGSDYHVSVVRYFGDGTEESDSNDKGPNIEFDGFGLSTWAAHRAGRTDLDVNADTLRALLDPTTGLIKADSSIWEVHWDGEQKRYAYTSIAAARGLCDSGDSKSALAIRDAMLKQLVLPTGGVAQSYEELQASLTTGDGARDAAVIEAINFGLLNPLGDRAQKTVAELEKLRVPTGWGFFRNDDGGGYDSQEWVFVDLRVATALHRMGRLREAEKLLGWITAQASLNLDLIPELMHRENADYAGAVPMVGFGAGAYILALLDRETPVAPKDPCFPSEGPDVTTPEMPDDAGATDAGVSDADAGDARGGDANSEAGFDATPIDGDDSGVTSTSGANDAGKSGCSCSTAATSTGDAPGRWILAGAAVIALRRRRKIVAQRRATRLGARTLLSLGLLGLLGWTGSLGCSSSGDDGGAPDVEHDASADVIVVDTALPGDGSTLDTRSLADGAPGEGGSESGLDAVAPPPGTLPLRDCQTSFSFSLGRAGASVALIGEWDGFTAKTAMTDGLGTGTYRVEATLPAGSYGYKFIVDGTDYRFDPATRYTRYVAGIENSRIDVDDCHDPLLSVVSADASADGTVDVEVQYVDGADGKGPDVASLAVTQGATTLAASAIAFDTKSGRVHLHLTGLARDKYTFDFAISDLGKRVARPLIVPMWVEAEPFEWQDGPLYFAFTDRFRNGDPTNDAPISGIDARANYQGGDWAGVLSALKEGYFDALGVRSIWLSPPNQNTNSQGIGLGDHEYSGYHGYWPTKARATEDHFGTLDALRAVTAEAHRRGIRVILDLVNNQLHQEHEYVTAHSKDGWFNGDGTCVCGGASCDWDTHAIDCWFTSYLPDVNWSNMGAVDAMTDDALWWLTAADADGFRVDAVKHMQDIASTTLRIKIQNHLETGNARYWLVGETFVGTDGRPLIDRYVGPQALWGQFDFPLYWSIDTAFAQNAGTMGDLDAAVLAGESGYVPGAVMSPFLGNHDVTRFLSRAAGQIASDTTAQAWTSPPAAPTTDQPYDQTLLAFTFLLTQPGVPLIYYGDEIGMPGTADPDNRRMMRFGTDVSAREQKLLDRVRIVSKARGTLPGLRRGARRTLMTDGDGYVYARGASTDVAIVALNRGSTARSVHVVIPKALGVDDGTVLRDLLGGPSITVTAGAIDVPFTPRGASLFVR